MKVGSVQVTKSDVGAFKGTSARDSCAVVDGIQSEFLENVPLTFSPQSVFVSW